MTGRRLDDKRLSMRSMRSMRGRFIFRNRGPSLKVHYGHQDAGWDEFFIFLRDMLLK